MIPFGAVNYLAVLAAAVASFMLGWIWYSGLFGKAWAKETGKSMDQMANPAKAMMLDFVAIVITSFSLELLVIFLGVVKVTGGLKLGLLCGIGISAMTILPDFIYENRSMKLFSITAAYQTLSMVVMSVILSVWH